MNRPPNRVGTLQSCLAYDVETMVPVAGAALFTWLCIRKASRLSSRVSLTGLCMSQLLCHIGATDHVMSLKV